MRYWEFLIQQEGDQTWLPLETRQVEILEGRYRMAAHTSYDDTSVEVRVSQLLLDEVPPRRRVRKRKTMTNDSGLLAIFPYMQLSPGHWEIHCNSPDVLDDFLGEGWQYSVQLQVTPREEEEWEPDWTVGQDAIQENEVFPETLEHAPEIPSDTPVDEFSNLINNDVQDETIADPVQLQLKQQAYVTQPGQPLTLMGDLTPASTTPFQGQLWVELRDPQSASTLQEKAFDATNSSKPFAVTITLPEELSTQVILGAISARTLSGATVASASFTVTVGLAQMLDAIANQSEPTFEEEISIFPGTTEALVPSPEKTATLLDNDIALIPREIIPSTGMALPPQLKSTDSSETDHQSEPELPEFPNSSPSSPEAPVADNSDRDEDTPLVENTSENSDLTDVIEPGKSLLADVDRLLASDKQSFADSEQPPSLETDKPTEHSAQDDLEEDQSTSQRPFAEPRIFERSSIRDDDLDRELVNAALGDRLTPADLFTQENDAFEHDFVSPAAENQLNSDLVDEIDLAFQQLRLQERFWQKLNQFTQDGYRQSLEVKKALDISNTPSASPLSAGNLQSDEFVVYDSPAPDAPLTPTADSSGPNDDAPRQVAAPILDIPDQELVAGEWVAVRVRVPTDNNQVYVKVWMNDLQTRTLVDAPRLLMQLTPNDSHELETLMRVKIPTSCLELQFAAITIDMATLQESRKVIHNRQVMPPDNSLSIFDDLNF
ncbi:MAG: hypothetical protein AAF821_14695 [Cyanobacteria bacterium P01_D01_bin.156]